ncbi:MAG: hypothetical protein GY936_13140 [Ignavibacteriae bacterium]|nr:hypothetical protein [Ignavibacteriota bacterium]
MKEINNKLSLILKVGILFTLVSCSTKQIVKLDVKNITLINREFDSISNPGTGAISLDRKKSSGLAVLEDIDFKAGIIEVDILGENLQGKSFVGIAFNIQNDSTYEAVYFRPFNFLSDEKIRREHGMQYIYHSEYTWRKLRTDYEGVYEAEFIDPPSPDDWFTVIIKVSFSKVEVFHKKTNSTLMTVERLTETKTDKMGFWTGYGSKGSFRNLKVKNTEE